VNSTTSFSTATTLIYTIGAGITGEPGQQFIICPHALFQKKKKKKGKGTWPDFSGAGLYLREIYLCLIGSATG
jgi:hypothetical protein